MEQTNTRYLLNLAAVSAATRAGRRDLMARLLWSANGQRWILWDIYAGWLAAWSAFNLTPYGRQPNGLVIGFFFGLIMGATTWICGMPRPESNPSRYEVISVGIISVAIGVALCMVAGLGLAYARIGRWIWLLFAALASAGIIIPRLIISSVESAMRHRLIIYGTGKAARAVLRHLAHHPGMTIVGFLDDRRALWSHNVEGLPCLGGPAQAAEICRRLNVQMLAVAANRPLPESAARRLLALRHAGLELLEAPEICERFVEYVPLDLISSGWLLSGGRMLFPPMHRLIKRGLDVLLSATALFVSAPLWGLIALAIKLDDGGPVFFSQWRMGRANRPFRIFKFRTMRPDAEPDGARWAETTDQRVTRLGRWLRLTRLDELPQLVNVLRGEMALVGPRPERPEFIAEIEKVIPYYDQRGLIAPGITGWAQVKYRYGASLDDVRRKLEYDLYYIRHMSFRLDLQILMRTLVLLMKGSR